MIESDWIIPSVDDNGTLTLNVATNSTLSANTFYHATLITAMDMMEAGSIQFCECTITCMQSIKLNHLLARDGLAEQTVLHKLIFLIL